MVSFVGVNSYKRNFQLVSFVLICNGSSIFVLFLKNKVSLNPLAIAAIFTARLGVSDSNLSYNSITTLGVTNSLPAQISSFSHADSNTQPKAKDRKSKRLNSSHV